MKSWAMMALFAAHLGGADLFTPTYTELTLVAAGQIRTQESGEEAIYLRVLDQDDRPVEGVEFQLEGAIGGALADRGNYSDLSPKGHGAIGWR